MNDICKTCLHLNPVGECSQGYSAVFDCDKYMPSQCRTCFYCSPRGDCKKSVTLHSGSNCTEYLLQQETKRFKLAYKDLFNLCFDLRDITSTDIAVRYDIDSSLAANIDRGKILVFLDKILVGGLVGAQPEFFIGYITTLEPFMYMESIECIDPNYRGCKAHIFEYPCGTQSLQIKIICRVDRIDVVSFHLGVNGLAALQNKYRTNSEKLPVLAQTIKLYFGAVSLEEMLSYTDSDGLFYADIKEFFAEYKANLTDAINSIVQIIYSIGDADLVVAKLSAQGALSVSIMNSDKFELNNFGVLHANLTLLTLSNEPQLQKRILDAIAPLLTEQNRQWLEATEKSLINRLSLNLPWRENTDGILP